MQKKYVTQLSVNLIKEVFTHWPSKCLLLAVYALASALTDMVTARYNTAKCINSECLWAHDRNIWRFWPIFVWRHYALLRLSSGMLSLFVFVKTCQIYQHEVILAWPKIPHIYRIILDHSHKSINTLNFHALQLYLALLILETHDDSSVWIVCIKLCVYTCWCDAYMWYKRVSTPQQAIHV